ncbi:MAG: hypothetical protein AMJ79_08535 [Phycisphaerae bacterium SM23_30]|nr:MAG: hypothetical protein AMJ79_08535 [Phycisphaerae bacterium SM23_30]
MADIRAGIHYILELYGCPGDILNNELFVREALQEASKESLSTLLKLSSHKFQPQGVTALGLLAESHMSIHTWPELNYVAIDIFTCGENANPQPACEYLIKHFAAREHHRLVLSRGAGAPKACNFT